MHSQDLIDQRALTKKFVYLQLPPRRAIRLSYILYCHFSRRRRGSFFTFRPPEIAPTRPQCFFSFDFARRQTLRTPWTKNICSPSDGGGRITGKKVEFLVALDSRGEILSTRGGRALSPET